jgi:ankyrin repeat protein
MMTVYSYEMTLNKHDKGIYTVVIILKFILKLIIQTLVVNFQSTPLHLAAGYNRTRIVQLLIQHGADVHAKDKGLVL